MYELETIIMIATIVGATTTIGLFVKERRRVIEEDFAAGMVAKDALEVAEEHVMRDADLKPLPTEPATISNSDVSEVSDVVPSLHPHEDVDSKTRTIYAEIRPSSVSPEEFTKKIITLNQEEKLILIEELKPEELSSWLLLAIESSSSFELSSRMGSDSERTDSHIWGWMLDDDKTIVLGVHLIITGKSGIKGTMCQIRVFGDDETKIQSGINNVLLLLLRRRRKRI